MVVNRRRRIRSTVDKANIEVYDSKGGREERRERQTSKSEAILVKVGQDASWIDAYREIVSAKDVLKESTGVRKTRAGHILIEINNKVSADEVAEKLKAVMTKELEILPLAKRGTLEMRNIDPIVTREELTENIATKLNIRDVRWITIKALRMAPWGTQQAVVVVPGNSVSRGRTSVRIRTGLTMAISRVISNILRCYRCHMLGHNAARCTAISPGRELCRKCGGRDHTINECKNESRCVICTRENRANHRHITGSLACPAVKERIRGIIRPTRSTR